MGVLLQAWEAAGLSVASIRCREAGLLMMPDNTLMAVLPDRADCDEAREQAMAVVCAKLTISVLSEYQLTEQLRTYGLRYVEARTQDVAAAGPGNAPSNSMERLMALIDEYGAALVDRRLGEPTARDAFFRARPLLAEYLRWHESLAERDGHKASEERRRHLRAIHRTPRRIKNVDEVRLFLLRREQGAMGDSLDAGDERPTWFPRDA